MGVQVFLAVVLVGALLLSPATAQQQQDGIARIRIISSSTEEPNQGFVCSDRDRTAREVQAILDEVNFDP